MKKSTGRDAGVYVAIGILAAVVVAISVTLFLVSQGDDDDGASPSSSSSEESTVSGKAFTVTEQWWKFPAYLDGYVQFAAVVKNPNHNRYGMYPQVRVTARDASGKVVGTQEEYVPALPPDATVAMAHQMPVTGTPSTVEIKYLSVRWQETTFKARQYLTFDATGVTVTADDVLSHVVQGEITNPYRQDVKTVQVVALLRDAQGTLVGGDFAYADGLPAAGKLPFKVSVRDVNNGASVATAQVIATPSGDDRAWHTLTKRLKK